MWWTIVKALLCGICASAPVGPAAILVIQKSLTKGFKNGFITGLGVALVDTIYAILSFFFISTVAPFLTDNEVILSITGGAIVSAIGAGMAFKNPFKKKIPHFDRFEKASPKDFFEAVLTTISNPAAIFAMVVLFEMFDITPNSAQHVYGVAATLVSVSGGCVLYWLAFSAGFGLLRRRFRLRTILWINRISGIIIMILGIAFFGGGIIDLIFN